MTAKKTKKWKPKTTAMKAITERRSTLDQRKKEAMLAVLIRNQSAHEATRDLLKIRHVSTGIGSGHALVWRVTRDFYKHHSELPDKNHIFTELHNLLKGDESLLDEEEREETDEFIEFVYDDAEHTKKMPTSAKCAEYAIRTCREFLEDQLAQDTREKVLKSDTIPADLPGFLSDIQQQVEMAQSLTAPQVDVLYPEGWDKEDPITMTPCNVPVLDNFFGGGMVGGEVYVFMGPFGSCKTTIAVQTAVNMARRAAQMYATGQCPEGKKPVAILISTEMDKREARRRCLSYAAQIPRKTLTKIKSLDELSKASKPGATPATKYEKRLFKKKDGDDDDQPFMNEYERATYKSKMLNEHLLFVDCSGTDEKYRNAGAGGMGEIASIIGAELRRRKDIYPIFACLDHASALANRMIEGSDEHTNNDLRHILKRIPQIGGRLLAKRYNIPLLVMHQLNGDANGRSPVADIHHTDAAECKAFAEYADFAVVTGPPTEDGRQLARFLCTKHRREPPAGYAIVKINGRFNEVLDVSKDYVIDHNQRQIVHKDELKAFKTKDAQKKQKAAQAHNGAMSQINVL